MAKVNGSLRIAALPLLLSGLPLFCQAAQTIPPEGIRAEERGAWEEALQVYRTALGQDTGRADLWGRISDILARQGRKKEAADALAQAAKITPKDPAAWARLSGAQAQANQPREALASIRTSLQLAPENRDYRRSAAKLLNWNQAYGEATTVLNGLLQEDPSDQDAQRTLGQALAWSGRTDKAVRTTRAYLEKNPKDCAAWMDLARMESWQGDFCAALKALESREKACGVSLEANALKARLLASSDSPRTALDMPGVPGNTDSAFAAAWANLQLQRPSDARAAVDELARIAPNASETREATDALASLTRARVRAEFLYTEDSDDLRSGRTDFSLVLPLGSWITALGGYHQDSLHAKAGSGLERPDGKLDGTQTETWGGLGLNIDGILSLEGRVGQARANDLSRESTYSVSLGLAPMDGFRIHAVRDRGYYALSPKSLQLGILRTSSRADMTIGGRRAAFEASGASEDFSDGNHRKELSVNPHVGLLRLAHLNLDIGLRGLWFGFDRSPGNGYYDPTSYRRVAITAQAYFKVSDRSGITLSSSYGPQKDNTMAKERYGVDGAVEGYFRLHPRWTLILRGAFLENYRSATSAYRGRAGLVILQHRF